MLEVLTANGIRPDLIVGTSVGAVNGAWLANGMSTDGQAQLLSVHAH
jgi:NTE family protein